MFYYIEGVLSLYEGSIVVVDCGGVGYAIHSSGNTISRLPERGKRVRLYTYLHVPEGIMDLYGFLSLEELSTFKLLLTVSGVGPKVALALLSELSPAHFAASVVTGDTKALSRASGVGPKMAQRIILELKDKLKSEDLLPSKGLDDSPSDSAGSALLEAVRALVVLGYSKGEAEAAVKSLDAALPLEALIKGALKRLMKA